MSRVCVVHELPREKVEETADLINEEWPRSKSSRVANLERSRDAFPLSLVLLSRNEADGTEEVVGHAKLSKVDDGAEDGEEALLVESVVIRKSLRGKGLGRKVMEAVQDEAQRRGFNVLYLATNDQVAFYERLGFEITSHSVSSLGFNAKRINTFALGNLVSILHKRQQQHQQQFDQQESANESSPSTLPPPSSSSSSCASSSSCKQNSEEDEEDECAASRCAGASWLKKRI